MKRIWLFIALLLIASIPASCYIPFDIPYGIWENATIGLTLDLDPDQSGAFLGTYNLGNTTIDVRIGVGFDRSFDIHDPVLRPRHTYLYGTFSIRDGKLHYKLKPHWQELTGIRDTIVFELIHEYETPGRGGGRR
jgi:hypothetical protein